jgi:outer membrane protein assembly factor BamA
MRQAKARALEPPKPPGLTTRVWDFIESSYGPSAAQWSGVAPIFGSVTTGGGFAAGARYRNTLLFDRRARLDVEALGSYKRYYSVDAALETRRIGGTPLFARLDAGLREFPQEDFFGLGDDARRADHTNFLYREAGAGVTGGVEFADRVSVGGRLRFLTPAVGRGRDSGYPSIEQRFSDAEAPGLISQPDFVLSSLFVDIDRTGSPDTPRTGGALRFTFTHAADRGTGQYTFRQADIDARHYFPFFQGKRVIVIRGLFSTMDPAGDGEVPFYMQPYLGGRRTLRGYDDQRFRGPHLLLLQAEYRFEVWPALDMALFVDGGEVEQRLGDLGLGALHKDYGISFRFGGEQALFRFDVAFGGETRRFSVAFGDVF